MTRVGLIAALLLGALFGACNCDPPPPDAGPSEAGRVVAVVDGDAVEVRLESLGAPLRTLQVDVSIAGANATSAEPAGDVAHDLIDAALDGPRSELTLVVADVRRVLLTEGAVARLQLDGPGTVELDHALAVDDDGARVELQTEVR
jgi:hypothetical protein